MTRKPRSHVIILIAQFLSAKQTDKKRESRRQASKLKEKKGDRVLEREIKKETFFLLEEQHENVVAAVTKWEMLAATNQMQGEMERQWKTVNENTHDIQSYKKNQGGRGSINSPPPPPLYHARGMNLRVRPRVKVIF